jgi:DNA-binding beta-propeller fold protein YncE
LLPYAINPQHQPKNHCPMSKRKADKEDEDKRPDPDGPWANKQFHPTPSFYSDYRRELLEAAAAAFAPVGGPPLFATPTRGPLDQCIAYIALRDIKPLLELVTGYRFDEDQLAILLARALHANLLEVVGKLLERAPALLNENLVEYAVRTRFVNLLSLVFLVTLLAEKNSTTVEQTANQALKRLGQDQFILDQDKISKLKELAREGAPADKVDDDDKEVEVKRHLAKQIEESPEPVFRLELDTNSIMHVCFTPDGRYLAVADLRLKVDVHDWKTGVLKNTLDFSIGEQEVSMLAFSPDGQTMYAAAHEQGRIMACRMNDQKADRVLEVKDWGYPYHMAVSHDGKLLAVGGEHSLLTIVDTAKWSLVRQISLPYFSVVRSVCFSYDDQQLFAATANDSTVYAFDTQAWVQRVLLEGKHNTNSMICHPAKPLLVGVAGSASTVWTYNYETHETIIAVFWDWKLYGCKIQFSRNGRYLVVAARGGEVAILDTEDDWKEIYAVDIDTSVMHMAASDVILGVIATCNQSVVSVFDIRGAVSSQDSLGSVVSAGLSNRGQPQSAWDAFLSTRLRDPRILLFANQFLTGSRHRTRC